MTSDFQLREIQTKKKKTERGKTRRGKNVKRKDNPIPSLRKLNTHTKKN